MDALGIAHAEIERLERESCDLPQRVRSSVRRRFELTSVGIDEYKQLVGTDGQQRLTATGLRVPIAHYQLPVPTTPISPGTLGVGRYLFQLCALRLSAGQRIVLTGIRQYATIGYNAAATGTPYIVELPITTPTWGFADGNIAWSLRRVQMKRQRNLVSDSDNFRWRFAENSSTGDLVYEKQVFAPGNLSPAGRPDFYTTIQQYVPPNRGEPYGHALDGHLSTFRDLRFAWLDDHAWDSLDLPIEGPCSVVLYASVRQTDPGTRQFVDMSGNLTGLPPEEVFLQQAAKQMGKVAGSYWRVAGSLIWREVC